MRAVLALLPLACACLSVPRILNRIDAETDSERAAAVLELVPVLSDPKRDIALRLAAAKVLGHLRTSDPRAISVLGANLVDPESDPDLRSFSAWALGEARSDKSALALVEALQTPLTDATGYYVIEALAKHWSILSTQGTDGLLRVLEAMSAYASTRSDALPGIYDVIGSRAKQLPALVELLSRASVGLENTHDASQVARCYNAAFELLELLDLNAAQIRAGGDRSLASVDAAVSELVRTLSHRERVITTLVLWYLGKISGGREIGASVADALAKSEATNALRAPDESTRFLSLWTLSRVKLYGRDPARLLSSQLFVQEKSGRVLELLGDLSRGEGPDEIQRILGQTGVLP